MGTDINFRRHLGRDYGTYIGLPTFDPSAAAYFAATGITGMTQQQAIDNLVKGLKADGLWSKMKAVYPFVTDQRNLAGYSEDITNSSGWAVTTMNRFANTTAAPNGTTTADTFTTTANANNAFWNIGWITGNGQTFTNSIYLKYNNAQWVTLEIWTGAGQSGVRLWVDVQNGVLGTANATTGTYLTSSISNEGNGWYRVSVSGIMPSPNNALLAVRHVDGNGAYNFTAVNGKSTFCWGAQNELGTLTNYQPQLGSAQSAISSQFKYNLVNPVDSDAAFRLVFNGGWTHSSTGATPNGTNGYADTKLVPSSNFSANNSSFGVYSRTNNVNDGVLLGSATATSNRIFMFANFNVSGGTQFNHNAAASATPIVSTSNGLFTSTRVASGVQKVFYNSSVIGTTTSAEAFSPASIFLSAFNNGSGAASYSNRQLAFSYIGDGLTDDEVTKLYYHIQVCQTSLNRHVGSPAYALPAVSDVNAKLYLSAIGSVTNNTFNDAVNTLITGLKADGIYSKMKAVYPFATDNVNSMSYTEDFSNAYWSKTGATVTSNNTTAPDGTLTADRVVYGTANNHVYGISSLLGGVGTQSFYVKGIAGETLYADDGYTSAPLITLTGNWQRVEFTTTRSAGQSHGILIGTYSGATARTIWVWGAQVDAAATATAYQPQLGSAQAYFTNQFKYNIINPQDNDAAFRLAFSGGWTMSPQGAKPNGTNGFADTKLNANTQIASDNNHVSIYLNQPGGRAERQIGFYLLSPICRTYIYAAYGDGNSYSVIQSNSESLNFANINRVGLFTLSRTASNSQSVYLNADLKENDNQASTILPSLNYFIGASNDNGSGALYSNALTQFSTIGSGLSATDVSNLSSRLTTFNNSLSR